MSHAFISYVHDDEESVVRLTHELRARNVEVWLDRDSIDPGRNWVAALRDAIGKGAFFLACFSESYHRRSHTYMHQELDWAVAELQLLGTQPGWLIPVKLSECEIPPLSIGGDSTLRDLQWVDLSRAWDQGILRLLRVVRPKSYLNPETERFFRDFFAKHIETKISLFTSQGCLHVPQLEARWRSLIDPIRWNRTAESLVRLVKRVASTGVPQNESLPDPDPEGCDVFITVARINDVALILQSLGVDPSRLGAYSKFAKRERCQMRARAHWERKDLAHWFFFVDPETDDFVVDLFFFPNTQLQLLLIGFRESKRQEGRTVAPWGMIIPTDIIGVPDATKLTNEILCEEAALLHPDASSARVKWWQFWRKTRS